jgi:hypothetical protein
MGQPEIGDEPQRPAGHIAASDRWARELRNGVEAFVTLWCSSNDEFPWYFDITFRVPEQYRRIGWDPRYGNHGISKIADEIMEVLDRHGDVISRLIWRRLDPRSWSSERCEREADEQDQRAGVAEAGNRRDLRRQIEG